MKLVNHKNIIITGCSSGIGYATALRLNDEGYNVFATCRKEKDLQKLKILGIKAMVLDYSDEKTIVKASKYILNQFNNNIYALFNNGAYALPGALEDIPAQALREIIETNLIGYHTLNRLIIPSMRKNGYGKIIHCSSVLGFICLPFRGAYNISKWALEGYCDTLRLELDGTGINVISIRPGPINTKIKDKKSSFADAPIARTRQAAIDGTLAIMVGSNQIVFQTIKPVLELMGSDIMHCGDVGSGQFTKILNNMILFQNVLAFRKNFVFLNIHRRRSGRVVECTGLENRRRLTPSVGSNPTSSANWLSPKV